MSGPTPRMAIQDPYRPMSREAIYRRLLHFEGPVGVTRRRFLEFCKATMPTCAQAIPMPQQERLSKAFWQLDRGYVRVTTGKKKNHLYLTVGAHRRQDEAKPVVDASTGTLRVDFLQGTLQWRPPSCR